MPLIAPPIGTTTTLKIEWIDPSDAVHDLTNSLTYFVNPELIGLGTAGASIADEKLPTSPGSVLRHISIPSTRIELPVTVITNTMTELATAIDTLRGWFDTGDESRRTPGYLRVTRPDGSVRQLLCFYAGGLEGNFGLGGPGWTAAAISLYAPDPWPTAPAATTVTWAAGVLPLVSRINEGQLDAYPIWNITGPATSISIDNNTTGKNFSLVYSLASGKSVTIDTRPASQRVDLPILDSDHTSRFGALLAGGQIFGNWLAPGQNDFRITIVSVGSPTVTLTYVPRYRGMLW